MVLIIVGILIGVVVGSIWLGSQGWILGAFLGGLAGLVLKQSKRISALESTIKTLEEEQALINRKLTRVNKTAAALSSESKTVKPELKPIGEITPPNPTKEFKTTAPLGSAELDLPDEKIDAITLSSPASDDKKIPAKNSVDAPPISTPREPDIADKIALAVRRFFTEGNPIVRIGMVIMFFGVSFLVKYASAQGLFPIEFRLTGVVLGAIALLVVGWKTRHRPGSYGLVLQGGGVAIIYLTLFAAAKIYDLLPLTVAFGLLFLVVILGVLLALLQNAQVLALLATAGGFLAPVLTSSGSGSHVGLFSFYLILNLGILSIAVYKAWRLLNWVGFVFTFVITTAWGVLKYDPGLYSTTQPFLIAFFILYLVVSILFSFKQPTNLKGMVDGSLVFGLPLVAFGLQTLLLKDSDRGLAISAVVLAAIYILLAAGLAKRYLQTHRMLIESFLALGVSFATLAVPLALDASWTSVTWALEATGLVWIGLRQSRLRTRVAGYLLHCAAVVSLLLIKGIHTGPTPVLSGDFLGLILLALSSVLIAYLLHYFNDALHSIEKIIIPIAMSLGILWWFVAGLNEINVHTLREHSYAVSILFATLSAMVLMLAHKKLGWNLPSNSIFALLPFMAILSLVVGVDRNDVHPTQGFSLLALAFFFAVHYRFLFGKERYSDTTKNNMLSWWHIFSAWYLFVLVFWEVSWQENNLHLNGTAELLIWFAAITIPVIILIGAGQKKMWPFTSFTMEYKNWIPAPLFLLAGVWFVAVCHETVSDINRYYPIFNPLDLAQFAIVLIFAYAAKQRFLDRISVVTDPMRLSILGIMLFVWLNVVTLRAMSHYLELPYLFDVLWSSAQVQMSLSILWSLCALLIMNLSRRIKKRELWIVGAGLLALVVLKLATRDLSNSDTLARIISFMVVGALMLLIGFLSPIPAKKSESFDANENTNTEHSVEGKSPIGE